MPRRGHHRHQRRPFTIAVRRIQDRNAIPLTVMAETHDDALLRAGITLTQTIQGVRLDSDLWIVAGVTDPAAPR